MIQTTAGLERNEAECIDYIITIPAVSSLSGASAHFHEDLLHCGQRQAEAGEPQTVSFLCVGIQEDT